MQKDVLLPGDKCPAVQAGLRSSLALMYQVQLHLLHVLSLCDRFSLQLLCMAQDFAWCRGASGSH